jgi:hypothetical protein
MKIQKFTEALIDEPKLTKEELLLFKKLQRQIFVAAKNYVGLNQEELLKQDIGEFFISSVEIIGNEVIMGIEDVESDISSEMECPIDEFIDIVNNHDTYSDVRKYNI